MQLCKSAEKATGKTSFAGKWNKNKKKNVSDTQNDAEMQRKGESCSELLPGNA